MFNNSLFDKEAKLKIQQREQEAETYRLQKQLGYGDRGNLRGIIVFVMLVAAMLIVLF